MDTHTTNSTHFEEELETQIEPEHETGMKPSSYRRKHPFHNVNSTKTLDDVEVNKDAYVKDLDDMLMAATKEKKPKEKKQEQVLKETPTKKVVANLKAKLAKNQDELNNTMKDTVTKMNEVVLGDSETTVPKKPRAKQVKKQAAIIVDTEEEMSSSKVSKTKKKPEINFRIDISKFKVIKEHLEQMPADYFPMFQSIVFEFLHVLKSGVVTENYFKCLNTLMAHYKTSVGALMNTLKNYSTTEQDLFSMFNIQKAMVYYNREILEEVGLTFLKKETNFSFQEIKLDDVITVISYNDIVDGNKHNLLYLKKYVFDTNQHVHSLYLCWFLAIVNVLICKKIIESKKTESDNMMKYIQYIAVMSLETNPTISNLSTVIKKKSKSTTVKKTPTDDLKLMNLTVSDEMCNDITLQDPESNSFETDSN